MILLPLIRLTDEQTETPCESISGSDRKPEYEPDEDTEPELALGVTPRIIRLLPAVLLVYPAFRE